MAAAPPLLHFTSISPSISPFHTAPLLPQPRRSQVLYKTPRRLFSVHSNFNLRKDLLRFAISSVNGRSEKEESEEEFEVEESREEEEEEEDGGLLDFESLEEEARDAVRDYSRSLARQLGIEDGTYEKSEFGKKQKQHKALNTRVPDHLLPRVAIVGRPNVGKSALFNRLVGGNRAIVVDEPGVTRDRLYGRSFWGDSHFMVVDTGGVMTFSKSRDDVMEELAITTTVGMDGIPLASREAAVARMPSMIERQAATAVEEAAVIIFLVDGQAFE